MTIDSLLQLKLSGFDAENSYSFNSDCSHHMWLRTSIVACFELPREVVDCFGHSDGHLSPRLYL